MLNKKYIRIPLQIILIILVFPITILGTLAIWVIRLFTRVPAKKAPPLISVTPDLPRNFALKNGLWLAVKTSDSIALNAALKLAAQTPANWETGLELAQQWDSGYNVFICPPIGDWTFIVTSGLYGNYEETKKFLAEFPLFADFSQIYSFMTHSTVGYDGFIVIESGHIKRIFIRSEGRVEENFGNPVPEEEVLYGTVALKDLSPDEATAVLHDYEASGDLNIMENMQALCARLTGIDPSCIEEMMPQLQASTGTIGFVAFR